MVVAEGRKLAQSLSGTKKANLQQLCDDVEQLTYQLSDMCRRGQVSGSTCRQIKKNIVLFYSWYLSGLNQGRFMIHLIGDFFQSVVF